MKKYIDCDGVILNTLYGLFDDYYEMIITNPELTRDEYMKRLDWRSWLRQSGDIHDALEILRNYDPNDADILTKVNSIQETIAKIEYFREAKVKNNIIVVPYEMKKTEVVNARNNILVDDTNNNLDDWSRDGGYAFYFGSDTSIYPKIETLEDILNPKKLEKNLVDNRYNKKGKITFPLV